MRPLTRLLLRRSIRPTPLRVSPVQIACFHATPTSRYASEKSGLTQRLRQKIWGGNAPGPEDPYTTAEETKQVEEVDMAGYVAAEDGRGLPIIGLPEKLGEWALDTYSPSEKVVDTEALHRALHRAVVETVVLQVNGRELDSSFGYYTPKDAETLTDNVELSVQEDGSVQIAFPQPEAEEAILSSLQEVIPETPAEDETVTTEEVAASDIAPTDAATAEAEPVETAPEATPVSLGPPPAYLENPTHLSIPLPSSSFTFALYKRILQLTGHQIPDGVLTRARTVGDLVPSLIAPPKPKKLSEELEPLLADLPNVRLFEKKRVGLDKETELGRARKVDPKETYRYKGIDPDTGFIGERPYSGKVNDNFY
ncbi:hypothetical protein EX30DRAFT_392502 [Ascodesmis nigricans]|uniref:Large ribosomal subunit protein mL50 n=1 Tax=Ascodesmis nigricans TaxID=341454 RepID=A0A4S2N7K2_9PEZI|nr:hypothetical protein EX30DRAFT_392502 [Ascodesmis nigricans]